MNAIRNALHSNKNDDSSHQNTTSPTSTTGTGLTGNSNTTAVGSTTGDATHTTLQSGHNHGTGISGQPTNASATRETGLTGSSTSVNYNTGAGRSTAGSSHLDHTTGHDNSIGSKFDPTGQNVTHDHKHLNHVVHKDVRHVEVEEVERQREVDRHVHHVQHHVQPVLDKQVQDEVHHTNAVPVTEINERHSSTNEDRSLFQGLAAQHKDTEVHRGKERTVVDLGEKVHENVHHHVHHVTQPVIEKEIVDRHRIHTVIPVHHTTHEAPVIHKSSVHEPVTMDSFLQGGGKLGSGITHENAGVLATDNCERSVDGVGEKLAQDLHLSQSSYTAGGVGAAGAGAAGLAGRSRRPGRKAGRTGSMSSVSSSDEEGGSRAQKREKRSLKQKITGH